MFSLMSFIFQVSFFCSDYKQCRFAMTANGLRIDVGGLSELPVSIPTKGYIENNCFLRRDNHASDVFLCRAILFLDVVFGVGIFFPVRL